MLLAGGDTVPYDYLLIALGFEVETYGTPGIKENAFEIRSFRSSKAIYNQIIKQFNLYKQDQDPSRLTFVLLAAVLLASKCLESLLWTSKTMQGTQYSI